MGGEGIPNHSWNGIELDDRWYLCDATWASGSIDPQKKTFVQHYSDVYFLTDPKFFILNHYPLEAKWTLVDHPPTLTEFLNAPLAYASAIRDHVTNIDPYSFKMSLNKGDSLNINLHGHSGLAGELTLWLGNSKAGRVTSWNVTSSGDCSYRLSHRFRYKGNYAVHIRLSDEHLYS